MPWLNTAYLPSALQATVGVYGTWNEPRKYQLLSNFVAGSQCLAWSHMGLEEPVMRIGNNFVGMSGKSETFPLLGGLTILPIVVFKYKDTSQWKNSFKQGSIRGKYVISYSHPSRNYTNSLKHVYKSPELTSFRPFSCSLEPLLLPKVQGYPRVTDTV